MSNNIVRLHRVLKTTPEKIYRAFLEEDAMARWLPPDGFTARVYEMDPQVGGGYKMSFTNFTTGNSHGILLSGMAGFAGAPGKAGGA